MTIVVTELRLYVQCRSKEGTGQAVDKTEFKQLSQTEKQLCKSVKNLNYTNDTLRVTDGEDLQAF